MAIVRALVPVAWADGVFAEQERETLEALLDAFGASEDEKNQVREYAKSPRTLDDIELQTLSADDRRILLRHAVLLSFVDGTQGDDERAFLEQLATRLKIPADESVAIQTFAAQRAKGLLDLL